eukprot:TRINITY_DN7276_c2_g1_i1.p1 TRINITY_DN7276_c2_g1~~TRINITY_DN7276_c2_g1_i1.p1  ORF type:complete len:911 (+),score=195.74 TRINITY_DN7276_c2_g1_i1:54-2786(+)
MAPPARGRQQPPPDVASTPPAAGPADSSQPAAAQLPDEQTQASGSGTDGQHRFTIGQWVRLRGLEARAELNGCDARVLEWCSEAGRWAVRVLGSAECVRVRARNLDVVGEERSDARDDGQQSDQGRAQRQRRGAPGDEVDLAPQGRWHARDLPRLARQMTSALPRQQRLAAAGIRSLLAGERPPIDQVLAQGCVPKLVDLLRRGVDDHDLQIEAAWALTNIASGTKRHTKAVVDAGAIEVLVAVLKRNTEPGSDTAGTRADDVAEQAVWALANIAGDSIERRSDILRAGTIWPLVTLLGRARSRPHSTALQRELAWCVSQLCRGEPGPALSDIAPLLEPVGQLLWSSDREVVMHACWAVSYVSGNVSVDAVHKLDIAERLVEILRERKRGWLTPALNTIGNLAAGDTEQAGTVIAAGALRCLRELMGSKARCVRKEVCWIVSNILAGTEQHIDAALDADLLGAALQAHADELDVRTEALWAVQNLVSGGSVRQVLRAVKEGAVPLLVSGLSERGSELPKVAIDALQSICDAAVAAGEPDPHQVVIDAGAIPALERVAENSGSVTKEVRSAAEALCSRLGRAWNSPRPGGPPPQEPAISDPPPETAPPAFNAEDRRSAPLAEPGTSPPVAPPRGHSPAPHDGEAHAQRSSVRGRAAQLSVAALLQRQRQRRREVGAEERQSRLALGDQRARQLQLVVQPALVPAAAHLTREEERLRGRVSAGCQEQLERLLCGAGRLQVSRAACPAPRSPEPPPLSDTPASAIPSIPDVPRTALKRSVESSGDGSADDSPSSLHTALSSTAEAATAQPLQSPQASRPHSPSQGSAERPSLAARWHGRSRRRCSRGPAPKLPCSAALQMLLRKGGHARRCRLIEATRAHLLGEPSDTTFATPAATASGVVAASAALRRGLTG